MNAGAERWRRLSQRFDALVECDWPTREAELAALSREDASFAQELRAMLAADDAADGGLLDAGIVDAAPTMLERLADGSVDSAGEPIDTGATTDQTPPFDRVGRFRLQRLLGRGGMGEVWLAEARDEGFVQQVALKLLKRGMDSDEIVRRFERERRILAQLHHPNVASFVDGGLAPDGRPWYAMEHVEGTSIAAYAQQRALDVRDRVVLLAQVCDAVAHAQTRLIVHRDLKPSNILVDTAGQPHVLDFGIAKLLDDTDDGELTRTGVRALSPAYAAPEQASGEPISTATDVFSLGVVLYELLTGRLPHQRSTGTAVDGAITIERPSSSVRRADAAQRSAAYGTRASAVERLARHMRGDLDTIVMKALRREPERRYASAAAVGEDLRRWLDGKPIRARPDSAAYRTTRFIQRHRLGVAAAALVVVSLAVGIGIALHQAGEARAAAVAARLSEQRAEEQASIATAVRDFLIQDVIQAANPYQTRRDVTLRDALVAAIPRIDARFGGNARLDGVLRRELGASLYLAGDMDAGEAQMRQAFDMLEPLGRSDPDALKARSMLARLLLARDEVDASRTMYADGIAAMTDATPEDIRLELEIGIAGVLVEAHEEERAIAELERLLPPAEARFGVLVGPHKDAVDHLLRALSQRSRNREALALVQRTRLEAERLYGADDPAVSKWVEREAIMLRVMERYDEALPLAERAYALVRSRLGDDHADTQSPRMQLAALLLDMKRPAEAEPLMRQVHDFRVREFGPDKELTWIAAIWYARALQAQGKIAEAGTLFQRTRAAAERVYGDNAAQSMPFAQTYGMFLQQTGDTAAALTLRRSLLEKSIAHLGDDHPNTPMFAWDVAETLASRREDAELIAFCATWMPRWDAQFDGDSRIVNVREWLARAREATATR